ncbi:MAG: histidinol phosphate phosphatase domain-containing protein [Nitrospirae bacterium]|nr:histidinol phosphate phosphatase domain-containing protein [Nitrospirota bacterium]
MIDLHTHSLLSDGELLPTELIRRAYITGYTALAITDHVDSSNMDFVIPRIVEAINEIAEHVQIKVIAGAELTHVPPKLIGKLVERARGLGAKLIVVHGETVAEPVTPGSNRAGIESGADILSHPGLITKEDALKALENGVALEITSRKGHSISNGHVFRVAMETGAMLVVNSDAHAPEDLITPYRAKIVLRGAGAEENALEGIFANSQKIIERIEQSAARS